VLDASLTALLCKKITVAKSKEVKTACNLAKSSKESYGSKRAVFPMMIIRNKKKKKRISITYICCYS
jgi:hypothetical protein